MKKINWSMDRESLDRFHPATLTQPLSLFDHSDSLTEQKISELESCKRLTSNLLHHQPSLTTTTASQQIVREAHVLSDLNI
jgi:hypothetical protein